VYGLSIMIILCARPLFVLRSRALGVAAAILCLVISLPGLGVMAIPALALVGLVVHGPGGVNQILLCYMGIIGLIALCQVATCLWGGISTLLFIFRPDVADVIREPQEREARVAETSTGFVSAGCTRAAIWQGILSLLMFLNVAVRIAIYWRLTT